MNELENRVKRLEEQAETNRIEIMRIYKQIPSLYYRLKRLEGNKYGSETRI